MLKKTIGIIIIVVTIFVIIMMVKSKKRPNFNQKETTTELKLITESVTPIKDDFVITANGNVKAKWQTDISSEVTGQIIDISDHLLVGASFKKGDVLLQIDATNYRAQLDRQQANLTIAQEKLFDEKMRSKRALDDWNSLKSKEKANPYTLRKPQLKSAQMNLQAAKSDLKVAQNDYLKTSIKAPYNGFVISRFVDLGESIQVGTKIAEISSNEHLELKLPLKNTDIEMILSNQIKEIKIFDMNHPEDYWKADYSRVSQLINPKNRWRDVFLRIQSNAARKFPIQGAFLQAQITVGLDKKFIKINENSLSMQGEIWLVDADNLLKNLKPKIAFRNNGYIYLYPEGNLEYPIKIVSRPSSSLLAGIKVSQQSLNQGTTNE